MMIDVMLLSGCLTFLTSEPLAKSPTYLTIFTSSFFFYVLFLRSLDL